MMRLASAGPSRNSGISVSSSSAAYGALASDGGSYRSSSPVLSFSGAIEEKEERKKTEAREERMKEKAPMKAKKSGGLPPPPPAPRVAASAPPPQMDFLVAPSAPAQSWGADLDDYEEEAGGKLSRIEPSAAMRPQQQQQRMQSFTATLDPGKAAPVSHSAPISHSGPDVSIIIKQATASGSFPLAALTAVLPSANIQAVRASLPQGASGAQAEAVFITAIICAVFALLYPDKKINWDLVAQKARKWIKKEAAATGVVAEAYEAAAQSFVNSKR